MPLDGRVVSGFQRVIGTRRRAVDAHRGDAIGPSELSTGSGPGRFHKVKTALLRLLILIGVAITPVWLGVLLWGVLRAVQWILD